MADDEGLLDEEEEGEYNIPAIIATVVVLLALIGGAVWYFVIREPPDEESQAERPEWVRPENLEEEQISDILPQMVINPLDGRGRYYLIVRINIAINDNELARNEIIKKPWRLAQVKNLIYDICSAYRVDELRTPNIKEQIRGRILEDINDILGWTKEEAKAEADRTGLEMEPPPIKDIYFEEYLVH